jgi:uncharacterized membrane protein
LSEGPIVVKPPKAGSGAERVAAAVDRLAGSMARHWVALFCAILLVFVGVPFLAPVFMAAGLEGPARLIYLIYRPTCHQLPDRSFFFFGDQHVYSVPELEAAGAIPPGLNTVQRLILRYPGSSELGYKAAVCERDLGIYGGLLFGLLSFAALDRALRRQGKRFPRMPFWLYALTVIPIAVDGLSQLVGLRESNYILRLVTGTLFGVSSAWLFAPYVQAAMEDVVRTSARAKAPAAARE